MLNKDGVLYLVFHYYYYYYVTSICLVIYIPIDYRPGSASHSALVSSYYYYYFAFYCCCRELRKQQRVKLHIHFFIALTLSAIFSILWYALVHYDLLMNTEKTQTVVYRNPVGISCELIFKKNKNGGSLWTLFM